MKLRTTTLVFDRTDPQRQWQEGSVLEVIDPGRAAALLSAGAAVVVPDETKADDTLDPVKDEAKPKPPRRTKARTTPED